MSSEVKTDTNWKQIMLDLKASITLEKLSAETRIPVSTLGDLRTGNVAEPKHGAGQRILNIYRREMAKQRRAEAREKAKENAA